MEMSKLLDFIDVGGCTNQEPEEWEQVHSRFLFFEPLAANIASFDYSALPMIRAEMTESSFLTGLNTKGPKKVKLA